jgi:hypothetical protein
MSPFQMWKYDTLFPTTTSTADQPSKTSSSLGYIATSSTKAKVPETALAGMAILIALCALLVGILQLRIEYQKRRKAQVEHELLEMESKLTEVENPMPKVDKEAANVHIAHSREVAPA